MFERFTTAARATVVGAQQEARDLGHPFIGTEHVLLAMLDDDQAAVARLLQPYGIDKATARADVERLVGTFEPDLSFTQADEEDAAALKSIGIDLDKVRAAIEESFGSGSLALPRPAPKKRGILGKFYASSGHIPFTDRNKKVLELSLREALRLHHNYIAPEHLMLGLLREGDGLACRVLAEHEVDFARLREGLAGSLSNEAA